MIRRYDEIMDSALANMIAKQDIVTDFNDGSVTHTLLDTFSRLLERAYVDVRQGYTEALRLIPYSLFGFQKKTGKNATGAVIFSRDTPFEQETIILKGTRLTCGDLTFITAETGSIPAGAIDSESIAITAEYPGNAYNVAPNMIKRIDSTVPSDVVKVNNPNATTGGSNEETTEEMDERFKLHINGLSGTNTCAVKSAALNIDAVRSVCLQEHPEPIKDIYNMTLYVEDGSGSVSDETIQLVRKAIEGDGTEQNPGHLAPGINARVLPPQSVPVDFEIKASVYRTDSDAAQAEIETALIQYINSRIIGQPVILAEIIQQIMDLSFVKDVKINTPIENIIPSPSQIVRFSTAEILIEEYRE